MRIWSVYRIVFRKEFRELLRDKRALFWLFAPPIILPGLALCAGVFIGTQAVRIAQDGFPIFVENAAESPELMERFAAEDSILLVDTPEEGILIVTIPDNFQDNLDNNDTASIDLTTRDNSLITFIGRTAVRTVIDGYNSDLLDQRLESQNLTRDWLTPISIGERTESSEERVESGGGRNIVATIFLPLAVTSWLLGGGMGLVLDATVGEKERQTIENLLVTPASRIGIVMGKMTVIFIASMVVMSMWLIEGMLLNSLGTVAPEMSGTDSISTTETLALILESGENVVGLLGALVVMIIPFTIMLNGLVMAWCAYAANYREANLFMALIQLGLPGSVLLTIFSLPAEVADPVYGVPLFGTIVGIRDLFSGNLSTTGLIINFVFGVLSAGAAIGFAAWVFGREWSLTRGLQ